MDYPAGTGLVLVLIKRQNNLGGAWPNQWRQLKRRLACVGLAYTSLDGSGLISGVSRNED